MRCPLLLVSLVSMATNAADTDNFNTEFFISQGMVHTSDNSVAGSAKVNPNAPTAPPKSKSVSLEYAKCIRDLQVLIINKSLVAAYY